MKVVTINRNYDTANPDLRKLIEKSFDKFERKNPYWFDQVVEEYKRRGIPKQPWNHTTMDARSVIEDMDSFAIKISDIIDKKVYNTPCDDEDVCREVYAICNNLEDNILPMMEENMSKKAAKTEATMYIMYMVANFYLNDLQNAAAF